MEEQNKTELPQEALDAIANMNREEPQEEAEAVDSGTETTNDDSSVGVHDSDVDESIDEGIEEEVTEESETEPESWVDDTEISFAQSYGLSADDLSEFDSRSEFRKFAKLLDKQVFSRKTAVPEATSKGPEKQETDEPSFKRVELDPDEYDESLVSAFNTLQDQLENLYKENSQLKGTVTEANQYVMDQQYQRMVNDFDSWVENLGYDDLFGPSDPSKRTTEQQQNRAHLWTQSGELIQQGQLLNQNVGWNQSTVERTANLVFSDAIERQRKKAASTKLVKQSKRRMGGGQPTKQNAKAWSGDPTQNPELIDAYRRMVNENGTGY